MNQAEEIENKCLVPALKMIAAMQAEREISRSVNTSKRTGQTGHMF